MQRKDVSEETNRVWAGGGDQVREEASGGVLRGESDRVPGVGQEAVRGRLQDQVRAGPGQAVPQHQEISSGMMTRRLIHKWSLCLIIAETEYEQECRTEKDHPEQRHRVRHQAAVHHISTKYF